MNVSIETAQPHVNRDQPIEFAHFHSRTWKGMFIAGSPLHRWLLEGGSPEDIPVAPETIVRDGSRSRCARIERLDEAHPLDSPMFFKAYHRRPGVQAAFKRMIGWHLPSWVWRTSWRLLEAGVPVPQPWGYLAPQLFRARHGAFCWTQWLAGARHAKDYAKESSLRHVVESEYYLHGAAELLGRLHNVHVYHRDMNWGNLMLDPQAKRIWLVDLDSAHRWPLRAHQAASRDVARFLLDAHQYEMESQWRMAFLEAYAQVRGLSRRAIEASVAPTLAMLRQRRQLKIQRRSTPTGLNSA